MSSEETSAEIASIAARVLNKRPAVMSMVTAHAYNNLLSDAKRLAGSALTQREPEKPADV